MKKDTPTHYGLGIDVSKKELYVHFMSKDGSDCIKIRGKRKFDNTASGIAQLGKWIEKHRKDKGLDFRVYLEVTGVYHERVLFSLHEEGYCVSLLMGKRVKAYGKSLGEDSKNDQRDSYVLGHMALSRKERVWKPVSTHFLAIRSLMRLRRSLINNRVAYQNQLHANSYSTHTSGLVTDTLTEAIQQIKEQIQLLEQKALELAEQDPELSEQMHRIVDSLDGIAMISLLEIISETNGFSEFHSINQLVKYVGLDIIENQSGKLAGKTRISKQGNARIRSALYMPVLTIIRQKSQPFFPLYLRVLQRNPKIKKKAMVAVQRKLLILIFVLWKKKQAFDPNYKWNQSCQPKREVALN
ncbi:MAG: IS110 family transposase [Bacteroidia bacterium]